MVTLEQTGPEPGRDRPSKRGQEGAVGIPLELLLRPATGDKYPSGFLDQLHLTDEETSPGNRNLPHGDQRYSRS